MDITLTVQFRASNGLYYPCKFILRNVNTDQGVSYDSIDANVMGHESTGEEAKNWFERAKTEYIFNTVTKFYNFDAEWDRLFKQNQMAWDFN